MSFGYRIQEGDFLSSTKSYSLFKKSIHAALEKYNFSAKFDVATYFNGVYHHDLSSWFDECCDNSEDCELFTKFFREINVGRSVDCLPQGIMPAKMIGSHFLKFIDNSNRIQCELMLRFIDDFYLFSDSRDKLLSDFFIIQRLLGEKALSVNSSKTSIGSVKQLNVENEIDDMKVTLLKRRREIFIASGWDDYEDEEDEKKHT